MLSNHKTKLLFFLGTLMVKYVCISFVFKLLTPNYFSEHVVKTSISLRGGIHVSPSIEGRWFSIIMVLVQVQMPFIKVSYAKTKMTKDPKPSDHLITLSHL